MQRFIVIIQYYKDFCGIVMPLEKYNTLERNQYTNRDKISYITDADIESIIKKTDRCATSRKILQHQK